MQTIIEEFEEIIASQEKTLASAKTILEKEENYAFLKERGYDVTNAENIIMKDHRLIDGTSIEKIAVNYRLRFLPLSYFKGKLGTDTVIKMQEAEKHYGELQYFVLAPRTMFELKAFEFVNKDPILFATKKNQYGTSYHVRQYQFRVIDSWGKPIVTSIRKILFAPLKSITSICLTGFLFIFLFFYCMGNEMYYSSGPNKGAPNEWLWIPIFMFVIMFITANCLRSNKVWNYDSIFVY